MFILEKDIQRGIELASLLQMEEEGKERSDFQE